MWSIYTFHNSYKTPLEVINMEMADYKWRNYLDVVLKETIQRHRPLVYWQSVFLSGIRDNAVIIAIRLRDGLPRNRGCISCRILFPEGTRVIACPKCPDWLWNSVCAGKLSCRLSSWGVDVISHLHLQHKLTASGDITPHAYMLPWLVCGKIRFASLHVTPLYLISPDITSLFFILSHFTSAYLTSARFTSLLLTLPHSTSLYLISSRCCHPHKWS
jgi:hypothetical protein